MGNFSKNSNKINNNLKEKNNNETLFRLLKNNKYYPIKITLLDNTIILKFINYQRELDAEDFFKIFNIKYESIEEIYNYIINIFSSQKIKIKDSLNNNELILIITKINDQLNINKEIELILFKNIEDIPFNDNPEKSYYIKDLSAKSYNCYSVDKTFIIFKAINTITYIVYATKDVSIICYSLNNEQIISEISNAHEREYITNFSHLYNKKTNSDIIMSISGDNNNIKLWNFLNWDCILNLKNVNQIGFLESACLLNVENNYYIITSNWNYEEVEKVKIFDFKGNKINELVNSDEKTYYINAYYEYETEIYYIIVGNHNYIKVYDYNKNKVYKKYFENENGAHLSSVVYHNKDVLELIESCVDGFLRIWNFHRGKLLYKIDTTVDNFKGIFGICLWNEKYLFIGCNNSEIKLIDLKNKNICKRLFGHKKLITCIKRVIHPKYGEALISQGYKNDQLKLWIIEK